MPTVLGLAIAVLCAALMGFAIQRGATCTVAAVDEVLTRRRVDRLLGMGEAALWVAGGLLAAKALDLLPAVPAGYAVSGWTVAGGMLLGFGAWLNRACVFGAIARLASGEWAYLATPLGYFVGCLAFGALVGAPRAQRLDEASPILAAPASWPLVAFLLFAGWRLAGARARAWTSHSATTVIGITFLFTLLIAGAWAYTDVLASLARGMAAQVGVGLLLFAALLAGAGWGGWAAGRWRPAWPGASALLRCFAGGALMSWGTLLIPGSNDGLILVGMPLLWPYAWVAFATMCLTIAAARVWTWRSSVRGG